MDPRILGLQAPAQPLTVRWTPLRNDPAAQRILAEGEAARLRRVTEDTDAASAEWQDTRTALAGNSVAVAVLRFHQPERGYSGAICTECCGCDDMDGQLQWPCETYRAVRRERPT